MLEFSNLVMVAFKRIKISHGGQSARNVSRQVMWLKDQALRDGYIESDHLSPQDLPLLSRDESLLKAFEFLFDRYCWRNIRDGTDKTQNPIIFVPASPGMGKSRLLTVLTRNCSEENSDAQIKRGVLEQFRATQQGTFKKDHANQFCDTMINKCIGVAISFQGETKVLPSEKSDDVDNMLGARVAYHFYRNASEKWKDFVDRIPKLDIHHIFADLYEKLDDAYHILLCVDEIILCAGSSDYLSYTQHSNTHTEKLTAILNCIGTLLDTYDRLHIVCSSLSYLYFKNHSTGTGRPVKSINLPNLNFSESLVFARSSLKQGNCPDEYSWIEDESALQIIKDCDGVPRLLEEVCFSVLEKDKSMDELRQKCIANQIGPIDKLSTNNGLLVSSLILALRGTTVASDHEEEVYDKAIYFGYLSSSSTEESESRREPIFPLLTILCLFDKIKRKRARSDSIQHKILSLVSELVRFDCNNKSKLRFDGVTFESYFRLLWDLRTRTRVCQLYTMNDHYRVRGNKSSSLTSNMKTFLGIIDDEFCHGRQFDIDLLFSEKFVDIAFDKKSMNETNLIAKLRNLDIKVCYTLSPNDEREKGLDDIRLLTTKKNSRHHYMFVFQYKWSKINTSTRLTNDVVIDSIEKSITNNINAFTPYIEAKKFAFIVAGYRKAQHDLSIETIRSKLKKNHPDIPENAYANICIMQMDDVQRFIPRPFRSRQQFRLT